MTPRRRTTGPSRRLGAPPGAFVEAFHQPPPAATANDDMFFGDMDGLGADEAAPVARVDLELVGEAVSELRGVRASSGVGATEVARHVDAWQPPAGPVADKVTAIRSLAEQLYARRPVLLLKGRTEPLPASVLMRTVRKPPVSALTRSATAAGLFKAPANTFIVIQFDKAFGYADIIVDPFFTDAFAQQPSTATYDRLLSELPRAFVGTAAELRKSVALLTTQSIRAYASNGVSCPPWRRFDAMLARWAPRMFDDQVVVPTPRPASPAGPLAASADGLGSAAGAAVVQRADSTLSAASSGWSFSSTASPLSAGSASSVTSVTTVYGFDLGSSPTKQEQQQQKAEEQQEQEARAAPAAAATEAAPAAPATEAAPAAAATEAEAAPAAPQAGSAEEAAAASLDELIAAAYFHKPVAPEREGGSPWLLGMAAWTAAPTHAAGGKASGEAGTPVPSWSLLAERRTSAAGAAAAGTGRLLATASSGGQLGGRGGRRSALARAASWGQQAPAAKPGRLSSSRSSGGGSAAGTARSSSSGGGHAAATATAAADLSGKLLAAHGYGAVRKVRLAGAAGELAAAGAPRRQPSARVSAPGDERGCRGCRGGSGGGDDGGGQGGGGAAATTAAAAAAPPGGLRHLKSSSGGGSAGLLAEGLSSAVSRMRRAIFGSSGGGAGDRAEVQLHTPECVEAGGFLLQPLGARAA